MEKFLSLTLTGAVSGAVYSLVAAGLVVSYSASGIFDFGHGAIAFAAAFVYFELHTGMHWAIVPAAVATVLVFAPLLGLVLDRLIFRPLAGADDAPRIMTTVGLLVSLPALCLWLLERSATVLHWKLPRVDTVFLPPGIGPVPPHNYTLIKGVNLDSNQVATFVAAAAASVALWLVLRRTRLGLSMRATVDRPALARIRGVDPGRSSAAAWVLGVLLAGLAGVVASPIFNSLTPGTYNLILFVAATSAVLGGLRSLPIAFAGGLVLGVGQNLVAGYATFASSIQGFNSAVPFVFLLVGLLFLSRRPASVAGLAADVAPPPDPLADLPAWRRRAPWICATGLLLVYIFVLADAFWLSLTTKGLALGLIFLSFVLVTGMGGMVSLAQASFVTMAGLTGGLLIHHHVPFPVAVLGGALAAVLVGMVVALPALRLGGLPLALATLALAFLGDRVLFVWDSFRNRQAGWTIHRPTLGPFDLRDERSMAVLLLILVGVVALLIRNLQRSPSGRAMLAVRSAERAAACSGVSPVFTKLALFAVSAAVAGVGGVMLGAVNGNVTNTSTPATVGLIWLATVVLFGIRRPAGAIVAGLVAAATPQILSGGFHWPSPVPSFLSWNGTQSVWLPQLLFGLGAIQLARSQDGVLALTAAQSRARRRKRQARRVERLRDVEDAAVSAEVGDRGEELLRLGALRRSGPPAAQHPGSGPAALALAGVRAGYGELQVLRGVDLEVRAGSITALLGANGAGKSTLCSVISGTVVPTGGGVLLRGEDVTGRPPHLRFRDGVILAPEGRGVFPGLSVEENLALRLRGAEERERAYERFPALAQRRKVLAGSLSGGEQQMLTLAAVVVSPPDVVVADEPTLGLAPLVVRPLMELFRELRDRGSAVLLVEEKIRDVLGVADRVAFIELGHIVWAGERSEIDDERLIAAYLGAGIG